MVGQVQRGRYNSHPRNAALAILLVRCLAVGRDPICCQPHLHQPTMASATYSAQDSSGNGSQLTNAQPHVLACELGECGEICPLACHSMQSAIIVMDDDGHEGHSKDRIVERTTRDAVQIACAGGYWQLAVWTAPHQDCWEKHPGRKLQSLFQAP